EASTNGTLKGNRAVPALYDSFARHSGDKTQSVTVRYGDEGPSSIKSDPPYSEKYPVTEAEKKDTLDPGSAIVHITSGLTATADNPCGTTAPVFDGRRRYDIQLKFVRKTNIKLDNGLYEGPALQCEIKYVQIAGYKQKILEEGK